jgi:hypothetical protein
VDSDGVVDSDEVQDRDSDDELDNVFVEVSVMETLLALLRLKVCDSDTLPLIEVLLVDENVNELDNVVVLDAVWEVVAERDTISEEELDCDRVDDSESVTLSLEDIDIDVTEEREAEFADRVEDPDNDNVKPLRVFSSVPLEVGECIDGVLEVVALCVFNTESVGVPVREPVRDDEPPWWCVFVCVELELSLSVAEAVLVDVLVREPLVSVNENEVDTDIVDVCERVEVDVNDVEFVVEPLGVGDPLDDAEIEPLEVNEKLVDPERLTDNVEVCDSVAE